MTIEKYKSAYDTEKNVKLYPRSDNNRCRALWTQGLQVFKRKFKNMSKKNYVQKLSLVVI